MNKTTKPPAKNKFKKGLTITILVLFLAGIIILFLIWRFGNATNISQNTYEDAITGPQEYNGQKLDLSKTQKAGAKAGIGDNTVIITGEFVLVDGSVVRYHVEMGVEVYYYHASASSLSIADESVALYSSNFAQNDSAHVPLWESLLVNLLPLVLIFGFAGYMLVKMSKGGGGMGSPFSMGKNRARQITSNVKFSDVAGIEEEKLELTELVDYLKNNEKYIKQGARIPRGVLMEGPPGTGKTLLAKAVAGEANVPFLSISGSEFEEMFVGVGASRIREMFNLAKKNSPSIIFIDEIDAVGRKRGSSIGAGTNEQTLNQLLVEMDGFGTESGVIVIAATNRVDVLDSALLRPGRFDRQIQIALPDVNAREAILKLHARNKKFIKSIDFRRVAHRTPGFSGAQLENVLNEAIILAIRDKREIIEIQDIDEAIDRVVAGPAKRSRAMRIIDKKIVSYHEAGHAVVGLKVENASKVQKVTIIPRGNAGGYTIMTPKEEIAFYSKEQLFAMVKGFLGGRASEEVIFGKEHITTGAHDDLEKATNIVRKMVTEYGMSNLGLSQFENSRQQALGMQTKISESQATKIDAEINHILEVCYKESHKIILDNRKLLDLLAEALNVLETITSEQIDYIYENNKLPQDVVDAKAKQAKYAQKEKDGLAFKIKPKKIDDNNLEDINNIFNNKKKTTKSKDSNPKKKDGSKDKDNK